ncbi:MAG: GTPase Era [Enterobacteriaceae bacterium PC38]|nr:MAG: GTPase Era [Enterobacteriaceae bacterium PC38]
MKQNIKNLFVSIIGRTNVGKSTLLNKLIKKKFSITSKKKNTTIENIYSIYENKKNKIIYIDNPGFILNKKNVLNYIINKKQYNIDIIIYIIEGTIINNNDENIIKILKKIKCYIILIINKIDIIKNKNYLLPYIKFLRKKINFQELIPISAKFNININVINKILIKQLNKKNEKKNYFNYKYSKKKIILETIREKIIRFLGQEIPYIINIKIQNIFVKNKYNIFILILVKNLNQKKIIIGKYGNKIKIIGINSKIEIEKKIKKKINLFLKVIINNK